MESGYVKGDSDNLPIIDYDMIHNFYVENTQFLSAEIRNEKTKRSARDCYGDNAVSWVQLQRKNMLCTVKCKITPEHKIHKKAYDVVVVVDEEQEKINSSNCNSCSASADECGQSGGEADSDEDIITDYHIPTLDMLPRPGPLPTISVTPHSPANKTYPVLEDSLQQVRELHESVQRMRDATIQNSSCIPSSRDFAAFTLNPLLAHVARLSASCPTLNEQNLEPDIIGGSLGSSPVHQPPSRKGSGAQDWLLGRNLEPDPQRRKSWTALEDLSGTKEKIKNRQRSISLSSMESEADESSLIDTVDGSTIRLLGTDPAAAGRRSHRGSGGGASTHSLNEADLQNDFNKIKAKREAEQLRLLTARLPLQKSISTPSIVAVRDLVPEPILIGAQPTLPVGRPSGTESETEEEGSRSGHAHFDPNSIAHLHHVAYDHPEKRRKRGSLFFRKKKDKNKKFSSHQWTSPSCGASQICDWCVKPLSNKPGLYCENCGTTVHQNTCKDNIIECNKPKVSKNPAKMSGFVVPLTNSKSSISKRGSASMPGQNQSSSSNRRNQLCYSPWRRVATKLGVNQILSDDKESDLYHGHHDNTNFPDDVPLVPLEFYSDTPLTAADLCSDRSLGLHESEPDSWTPHVGKEIARRLKEKDVKRQEHIYEFILTEKHHCMTLLVMKKVFADGLQKYFNLGPKLDRMFPRLADLTEMHLGFLSRLRQRQRESPIVTSIADILLEQFSNTYAAKLKSAYGEFCSSHRDAVDIYKSYLSSDDRFDKFVRHCQNNPLLKKKGIPECILFVTQRLTKYPLLIEPLIKTSKEDPHEQEQLQKVLALVKEILIEVDSQVAEKEKEDRKLEIYNRIEAKSYIEHRGDIFRKSDILQGNRALKFEGIATLIHNRVKNDVTVVVLSDVLFFLEENSHNKYTFVKPYNKAGVIPLEKLLVRDQAGQELRGIYLINQEDPEMLQLKVQKPKDKQVWFQAIRSAVMSCVNSKQDKIKQLVDAQPDIEGLLRKKDEEQAILLEEKMALQLKLLSAAGHDPPSPPTYRHLVGENVDTNQVWKEVLIAVQEVSHLASSLYTTGTNLSRSVSSAGEHHSETYTSPILPKRAETFGGFDTSGVKLLGKKLQSSSGTPTLSPDLENLKPGDSRLFEKLPWRNCQISAGATLTNGSSGELQATGPPDLPALLTLGKEQQYAAVHLSHYVYTLLCIISQLMTTNESLQASILHSRGNSGNGNQYCHNQQLEELRNLQDKLSAEKAAWNSIREQESKELEEKKQEVQKLLEQNRVEQLDIAQQREQLYRKMEILTSQGRLISPNVALPMLAQMEDSSNQSSEESSPSQSEGSLGASSSSLSHSHSMSIERRKDPKWNKSSSKSQLPQHLISATNQQKVSQNVQVKQQLPLKLASRLGSGSPMPTSGSGTAPSPLPGPQQMLPLKLSQDEKVRRTSSSGYQRLGSGSRSPTSGESTPPTPHSHSRTGSSPAMMQASPPGSTPAPAPPQAVANNNKASRTHTYPKLPEKYKVRGDQPSSADEEVIYF